MIRNAGIEPHVIEYPKTPPSRAMLASLLQRMETAFAKEDGEQVIDAQGQRLL